MCCTIKEVLIFLVGKTHVKNNLYQLCGPFLFLPLLLCFLIRRQNQVTNLLTTWTHPYFKSMWMCQKGPLLISNFLWLLCQKNHVKLASLLIFNFIVNYLARRTMWSWSDFFNFFKEPWEDVRKVSFFVVVKSTREDTEGRNNSK